MSDAPAISCHHLRAGYQNHVVLHDVSLRIDEGECVAVTGNNGSGKSTLLKTLIGVLPVMDGEVDILGAPVAGRPRRLHAPWYRVGYVPQRLASSGGIESTVQEVVQSGLLGTGHLRMGRDWKRKVHSALEEVGMAHRRSESFQSLSGGQQQRVLIARALVRKPSLLLFDEPLTGLDERNRIRLKQILSTSLDQGCTAVLVLHELGELRGLIRREIRLSSGHIAHDGPCTHLHHRGETEAWWEHDRDSWASSAHSDTGVWGGFDA